MLLDVFELNNHVISKYFDTARTCTRNDVCVGNINETVKDRPPPRSTLQVAHHVIITLQMFLNGPKGREI